MTSPADVVSAVAPALTALDVLRKARALIEKPEHWTQGVYAARSDRSATRPDDPTACSFCAIGAVARVVGMPPGYVENRSYEPMRVLRNAMSLSRTDAPVDFNDGHTHAEVLAAFDKAIASLESA